MAKRKQKQRELKKVERAINKLLTTWQRGEPTFREQEEVRRLTTLSVLEGAQPHFDWFHDILDGNNPTADKLRDFAMRSSMSQAGIRDIRADLLALLQWISLKTTEVSDTPNWFYISEGLADRLLVTDLDGVTVDDVKMPYPGFYFVLPEDRIWLKNPNTGWHELRGLAVCEGKTAIPDLHRSRALLICAICEPNAKSRDPGDDHLLWVGMPLDGEQTVAEAVEAERERMYIRHPHLKRTDKEEAMVLGGKHLNNLEARQVLANFVVNSLLYMSMSEADVERMNKDELTKARQAASGKKRPRLTERQKIARLENDRRFIVGSRIKIDGTLRDYVKSKETGQGFQLRFRSVVRGHWRNQAYGPKYSLRRRTWIQPHVRGGDLTKVLGHEYELKEKSKK